MARLSYFLIQCTVIFVPSVCWTTRFSRREVLGQILVPTTASVVFIGAAEPATAASSGFPSNPLVNPVLEQLRIWDQEQADNLKYDGELERGDAGNKGQTGAYPKLLVPILIMAKDLEQIRQNVQDPSGYEQAMRMLRAKEFEKIEFKKAFNAYGDNIYYNDPDRANVYLGGGATPKAEQSIAYLIRNEILTNIEDLAAELAYIQKTPGSDSTDLKMLADEATTAMNRYLAIVPPNELKQAREFLAENS